MRPATILNSVTSNNRHAARMALRFLLTCLAVSASLFLISANAQVRTPSQYISFDAPNAGTGNNQGTFPTAINAQNWIAGTVINSSSEGHGFLREPNGSFIP